MCSFTYVGAMLSSNSSLAYVSYPAQVLAKSCKPIPGQLNGVASYTYSFITCLVVSFPLVLVFSLLLGGKSYGISKFVTVVLIVSGVTVFMYKEVSSWCRAYGKA